MINLGGRRIKGHKLSEAISRPTGVPSGYFKNPGVWILQEANYLNKLFFREIAGKNKFRPGTFLIRR